MTPGQLHGLDRGFPLLQPMQKQYGCIQQAVSEVSTVSLYFGIDKPAHMIVRTPVMSYTGNESNDPIWFSPFDSS